MVGEDGVLVSDDAPLGGADRPVVKDVVDSFSVVAGKRGDIVVFAPLACLGRSGVSIGETVADKHWVVSPALVGVEIPHPDDGDLLVDEGLPFPLT